jgi:hypothetical protein
MGTTVAKTEHYSATLPAHLKDKKSERGSEGVEADDLSIPRIQIIQDLSPQHKENKAEYIKGAKVGMAFNTATDTLYVDGFVMVPVLFRKEYVIWKDRKAGGGFRGAFKSMDAARQELAQLEDKSQCDIVDTAQHFCLLVNGDNVQEAVISMSKSQMKVSRKLNTIIRIGGGDRFSCAYQVSVVEDSSDKGEFYNWKVDQLGYCSKKLFETAERMYDAVKTGERDVSRTDSSAEATEVDDEDFM